MNNTRRKLLRDIIDRIGAVRSDLEMVRDEESEAFDNIPENLSGTDRYERAEEILDALEEAVGTLEEMEETLEDACC